MSPGDQSMSTEQQEQAATKARQRKQLRERRFRLLGIALRSLLGGATLWILNSQGIVRGSWSSALLIVFTVLGVVVGLFQWLFPITSPVLATSAIRSKKGGADDAIRSFPTPSLHHVDGDTIAHVSVCCSVLERIAEVAGTGSGQVTISYPQSQQAPIPHPTAVVWGEADPILLSSWADRLEDYFSQLVGVQMLAGIGHFVPLEAPDALVEAIRTIL